MGKGIGSGVRGMAAAACMLAGLGMLGAQTRPVPSPSADSSAPLRTVPVNPEPSGLVTVQLQGQLVCPPVRLEPGRIVAATDDRRIQCMDPQGRILWVRDFLRQTRGPLNCTADSLIQVPLSARRIIQIDRDGRVLNEFTSPVDELVALDGGRWIGLEVLDGEPVLMWLSPSGAFLMRQPLKNLLLLSDANSAAGAAKNPSAWTLVPESGRGMLSCTAAGSNVSQVWRINPDGSMDKMLPLVQRPDPVKEVVLNRSQDNNSYSLRIQAHEMTLDFKGEGQLVHWSVDNREPGICIWGDSRWKLRLFPSYQYHAGSFWDRPMNPAYQASPVSGQDSNLGMEMGWLRSQEAESEGGGIAFFTGHVRTVLAQGLMAGRFSLYEDHLTDLLASCYDPKTPWSAGDRIACIRCLSLFPSFRTLPELGACFLKERDPPVLEAFLDYFNALHGDPAGQIRFWIQDRYVKLGTDRSRNEGLKQVLARMARLLKGK